jgi:hypothetical protein
MFSKKKKCVAIYGLQSITGVASANQVRYFVVVMMYLAHDILNGMLIVPIMFIAHL